MGGNRDNFSKTVIAQVGERVSWICSNPDCRKFTRGKRSDAGVLNLGVAAHIHAAAPGGARYDPAQTIEQRRSITNAIWLCRFCGTLVDDDEVAYPAPLLREWKAQAEDEARARIGKRVETTDDLGVRLEELLRRVLPSLAPSRTAFGSREIDLTPPPLVLATISRRETVAKLLASVGDSRWLALHGDAGIGKTHLAALLSRTRGRTAWLRLRGVESSEAAARVVSALDVARTGQIDPATFVIDDAPVMGDDLVEALVRLSTVVGAQCLVVSTSNRRLPQALLERLPEGHVTQTASPRLLDDEAADVFRAHGATALTEQNCALLNGLASGHATLLTAIARFLRARDWNLDDRAVSDLMSAKHLADVNDTTMRAIVESVPTEDTRQLLYRIKLVRGSFDRAWVDALASVEPRLSLVQERLADLDGIWVERQDEERFAVSPLVTALPPAVLDAKTRGSCYAMLASLVMSGPVSPQEIVDAALYHTQAGDFDAAAACLTFGLVEFTYEKRRVSPGDLLVAWWRLPLPKPMSGDFAVSLRCAQIAAGVRAGKDISFVAQDLGLVLDDRPATWGVVVGAYFAFAAAFSSHPALAKELYVYASEAIGLAALPNGPPLRGELPAPLETLLWLVARDVRTAAHAEQWLALIAGLPPSMRDAYAGPDDLSARFACSVVVDSFWLTEFDKPPTEQRWPEVLPVLAMLRRSGETMGFRHLVAAAARAEMIVLAEHADRLADALALADSVLPRLAGDPEATYLVQECLGRQRYYRGDPAGALAMLDESLASLGRDEVGGLNAIVTLNTAAQAATDDHGLAITYSQRAVAVARAFREHDELGLARTLGELAISQEIAGDIAGAYVSLSEAGRVILVAPRETASWRRTAALVAHLTGYVNGIGTRGQPPAVAPSRAPYARLAQGVFYRASEDAGRSLRREAMAVLCMMLAGLARVLKKDDEATAWAELACEEADADVTGAAAQLIVIVLPHLVRAAYARKAVGSLADPIVSSVVAASLNDARASSQLALMMSLVPLAAEILREPKGDARESCTEVARMCRDVAQRVSGPNSRDWLLAANMFDTLLSPETSHAEFVQLANSLGRSEAPVLSIVAGVVAGADPRNTLEQIVQIHLVLISSLPDEDAVRARILGAISDFWRTLVKDSPFRFSHPRILRAGLEEIGMGESFESVRRVVHAVADDLRVAIP
jgi:hypothetical protein